jgi:hypothetical protein
MRSTAISRQSPVGAPSRVGDVGEDRRLFPGRCESVHGVEVGATETEAAPRHVPYNEAMRSSPRSARDTFLATLDLFETGLSMMRQNLRRSDADATDQEIDHRLGQWLRQRPGAEAGDCSGRRVGPNHPIE